VTANGFHPPAWSVGGHRQTLLGYWVRRRLTWGLPTEDLIVDTAEGVRLLVRASWQPGERTARPALVLVHGLGGSDTSGYLLATGQLASSRGWHVLRMNMRGAGDGAALDPRIYNAGLESDVVAVLAAAARLTPRVAVAGFSLGGNLALLALSRSRAQLPAAVAAGAAISPSVDLAACADALERRSNRPYQQFFIGGLRRAYARLAQLRPDLYEAGRERATRSVREFDAAITAPYGGYQDVNDYYARASSGPHLAAIERPTLIVAAADDPMVPGASVARWPLPTSGHVVRLLTATGGHVGFVGATATPGRFWAAQHLLDFLERA
jgi:predicted alpha/beta-fold hydrolase